MKIIREGLEYYYINVELLQAAVKGMVNIMMLGKIIDFMELNQMVEKGDSIVIGVSEVLIHLPLYVLSEISRNIV